MRSDRVRIVGGWQSILDAEDRMHLVLNEEKKIRFDTSQAGPGTLKADIRSTDGLRLPHRFEQQGTVHTLHFTAVRDGKYDITVTYDGNPLPNMPIRAMTNATSVTNASDHLKVEVQGRGSYEAKVNEEAEFIVDASKTLAYGAGMPVVRLTGVQNDIEVRIRQTETSVFRCSYTATVPGRTGLRSISDEGIDHFRGLPTECHLG